MLAPRLIQRILHIYAQRMRRGWKRTRWKDVHKKWVDGMNRGAKSQEWEERRK